MVSELIQDLEISVQISEFTEVTFISKKESFRETLQYQV